MDTMIVTNIESITKNKYRVFIDEEFAFVLYKGELFHYQIKSNHEISEETIDAIKSEVLNKRAKLRAMHLLTAMPRTEKQLREKLAMNEYPVDVIEVAVSYVKSFGYINDEAYVRNFIVSKKNNKSKREIMMLLGQKGLKGEMIEQIVEEMYAEESELSTIRDIMRRKRWEPSEMDEKAKQKAFAYFMRKGFSYEEVRRSFSSEYVAF